MNVEPLEIADRLTGDQFTPTIARLKNNNIVFLWADSQNAGIDQYQLKLKVLSPDLTEINRNYEIGEQNEWIHFAEQIVPLDDGGFLILWESERQEGDWVTGNSYMFQRFDSRGLAVSNAINLYPEFQLSTHLDYAFQQDGRIFIAEWKRKSSFGSSADTCEIIIREIDENGLWLPYEKVISISANDIDDFLYHPRFFQGNNDNLFVSFGHATRDGGYSETGSFHYLIEFDSTLSTHEIHTLSYQDVRSPFILNVTHIKGLGFAVAFLYRDYGPNGGQHGAEIRVYDYDGSYLGTPLTLPAAELSPLINVVGQIGEDHFAVNAYIRKETSDHSLLYENRFQVYDFNFNLIEDHPKEYEIYTNYFILDKNTTLVSSVINVAEPGFYQDFDIFSEILDIRNSGASGSVEGDFIGTAYDDDVTGQSSSDFIWLRGGNDFASGGSGNDFLGGGSGDDTLDGGEGADSLDGGEGADFYFVDNTGDVVTETNAVVATGGYDIVTASANYTLSDNVEQLVIQGGATQGTGGNTANYLYGGNSGLSLRLDGGGGDDVIYAGLAGGNTLIGGSGVDTLLIYGGDIAANNANGGIGADIYYTYSVNDVLSEVGGDGIDTVYSSHNITLAAGFEQLLLFGLAISATGSADNNIMYGNSTTGPVNLSGLNGSDVLVGGNFGDTLDGGVGVDLLFGYGGTNTLIGGDDTDVYYLETSGNIITETTTGGFDTVYSNVTGVTTLAANVEQLILYGNTTTGGTGTSGNDYLYANAATNAAGMTLDGVGGADYLLGSAFADTLIGGTGNDQIDLASGGIDRIRYNAAGNMGADTVYNFNAAANDLIDLTGQGYVAGNIGSAITIAAFGGGTLVTFASGSLAGTTINLTGVAVANVTGADFVF